MYRESDWVYVIAIDSKQEGFIPFSYCVPYNSQLADIATKKKLPRDSETIEEHKSCTNLNASTSNTNLNVNSNEVITSDPVYSSDGFETEITPFRKDPMGSFIVLYTFIARDENDVSVERGEFVTGMSIDANIFLNQYNL